MAEGRKSWRVQSAGRPVRRRKAVAITAAFVVAAFAACGNGENDAADNSSTTATSAQTNNNRTNGSGGLSKPPGTPRALANFGNAANASQIAEIEPLVRKYTQAIANSDGHAACKLMTNKLQRQFATFARQSTRPCHEVARTTFADIAKSNRAKYATIRIAAIRVKGDTGRAIYRAPGMPAGVFNIEHVDDTWKIAPLSTDNPDRK